ncbi:MAG: segregation and condensation protein A [Oscillospiraceae bacterium]
MEQLSFKIPVFEGPLDLLLHLVAKHKLNINDIPITELVDQYLEYIDRMAQQDMEIAGEFLEMAARLIYIKTVSLLPRHDEAKELKKELEGRLVEYSLCKQAAETLRGRYTGGITVKKPMAIKMDMTYSLIHDPETLRDAYLNIDVRKLTEEPVTGAAFAKIISAKYVPVTSKIVYVLKCLYRDGKCSLTGLFDSMTDRSERVAAFLAVLELTKSGRILLNDDNSEIAFNEEYSGSEDGELHSDFDDDDKPKEDAVNVAE